MIDLEQVTKMLDAKDTALLYEILMEKDDQPLTWGEAEELLDDLYRGRLERELRETGEILSLNLSEADTLMMSKYHRGITRALQAEGTFGKLSRRYICEEIAKFEQEQKVG